MKQTIKNRGDWFMVGMLVRYECPRKARGMPPQDERTWLNFVLMNAVTPQAAYKKAIAKGRDDARSTNAAHLWRGKWKFLGITALIPISNDIEDGAELLWSDLGRVSRDHAKTFMQTKASLTSAACRAIRNSKPPETRAKTNGKVSLPGRGGR
jgi:hypothetical protein